MTREGRYKGQEEPERADDEVQWLSEWRHVRGSEHALCQGRQHKDHAGRREETKSPGRGSVHEKPMQQRKHDIGTASM